MYLGICFRCGFCMDYRDKNTPAALIFPWLIIHCGVIGVRNHGVLQYPNIVGTDHLGITAWIFVNTCSPSL